MLIDRIFNGNDAVYGLTVQAVDGAIAQHGADKAVGFPHTAYCLPCYYAVTGVKVKTLGEMKEALGVVKTLMTREQQLDDALMSGVATALCAEFIEALKYLDGAEPYSEPCYGHLADSIIREMGVPLVTGDIPGVGSDSWFCTDCKRRCGSDQELSGAGYSGNSGWRYYRSGTGTWP